eukprot:367456_1
MAIKLKIQYINNSFQCLQLLYDEQLYDTDHPTSFLSDLITLCFWSGRNDTALKYISELFDISDREDLLLSMTNVKFSYLILMQIGEFTLCHRLLRLQFRLIDKCKKQGKENLQDLYLFTHVYSIYYMILYEPFTHQSTECRFDDKLTNLVYDVHREAMDMEDTIIPDYAGILATYHFLIGECDVADIVFKRTAMIGIEQRMESKV